MSRPETLSDDIVLRIKEALWRGRATQADIAREFGTDQPTVSRIARGALYPLVPWPDGSNGHMPEERWKEILAKKRSEAAYKRWRKEIV